MVVGGWIVAAWRKPASRTAGSLGLPAAMDGGAIDESMDANQAAGVKNE